MSTSSTSGRTATVAAEVWIRPPASVSGLYFAHPQAHYFGVGKIDRDQVAD